VVRPRGLQVVVTLGLVLPDDLTNCSDLYDDLVVTDEIGTVAPGKWVASVCQRQCGLGAEWHLASTERALQALLVGRLKKAAAHVANDLEDCAPEGLLSSGYVS
jgi:hypothetical protein